MNWKDLEESRRSLIEVLSRYLPGGTEENREKLCQDSRCPDRDSNRALPEYKSEVLPLHHHAQCMHVKLEVSNISVAMGSAHPHRTKAIVPPLSVYLVYFLVSASCRPILSFCS
jgi:hypothetical protein